MADIKELSKIADERYRELDDSELPYGTYESDHHMARWRSASLIKTTVRFVRRYYGSSLAEPGDDPVAELKKELQNSIDKRKHEIEVKQSELDELQDFLNKIKE